MYTIITETERNYLLNSMEKLLGEYDYDYNWYALDSIIDEWASQKETLIEAFKKHPNYIEGKFMIAFDTDYTREMDKMAVRKFSAYLNHVILSMKDTIPESIEARRIEEGCGFLPNGLCLFFIHLNEYAERNLSIDLTKHLAEIIPEVPTHIGEKMSRVVNKICKYLGYDKHPDYNREYAKFADALSPLVIKRHTILSLNPLDYLTMSFGNSWASCHTIDKANRRGMPNNYQGQYSSGTMSYMLDPSSMVLYTVDASYDGNEYWTQPKINRQMFHWGENKLVQSRLYPQGNDGCDEVYKPYRELVQEIISTIFDFPNLWNTTKGAEAASRYIITEGTHYEDYENFDSCRLCVPKDNTNEFDFTVGASPICIECGERHNISENINCCTSEAVYCADCGCRIDSEYDEYCVDGCIYCRNCVSYCDHCEEYHRENDNYIESTEEYVCDYCRDNYYSYCDICHNYAPMDNVRYIEAEDICVCENCEEEVAMCEHCEREFLVEHLETTKDGITLCSECMEEE